ncbi:hypothetical protein ABKN59_011730, partial [Abortiporus biennis]
SSINRAACEQR